MKNKKNQIDRDLKSLLVKTVCDITEDRDRRPVITRDIKNQFLPESGINIFSPFDDLTVATIWSLKNLNLFVVALAIEICKVYLCIFQ